MSRILAAVLVLILAGNGLAMLFASFWWYNVVPGVTATGAFNPHFVRDIGAAYLVAGLGAAWFLWRPVQGWPALTAGALFLVSHAAIHVFDASCSASPTADLIRDLPGVYLTAIVAVGLAVVGRPGR